MRIFIHNGIKEKVIEIRVMVLKSENHFVQTGVISDAQIYVHGSGSEGLTIAIKFQSWKVGISAHYSQMSFRFLAASCYDISKPGLFNGINPVQMFLSLICNY